MMKKRLKSMYDHMELSDQQKNAIWENINWENTTSEQPQKKRTQNRLLRMALPAAAAFAVIILSGTAVLAATGTFSVDRIVETLLRRSWENTEPSEATSEQIELYTQYSDLLGIRIEQTAGTLYLDEICYDHDFLHIPFRYVPDQPLEPGSSTNYDPFVKYWFRHKDDGPAENEISAHYYLGSQMSVIRYTDPYVREDGSVTGWICTSPQDDQFLAQGDVIQLCLKQPQQKNTLRRLEEGEDTTGLRLINILGVTYVDMYVPPVVVAEIPLNKASAILELSPELLAGLPEEFTINSLSLSALSLYISGSIDLESSEDLDQKLSSSKCYYITDHMTIVMKDGRVIGRGANSISGHLQTAGSHGDFNLRMQFQEAIDLDDAEWLHIEAPALGEVDLWVPIHQE